MATTEYKKSYEPTYVLTPFCKNGATVSCSPTTQYGWVTQQTITRQENLKISRTRPPLPLFKSPTALPEQYRILMTYRKGVFRTTDYLGATGCCGPGVPVWAYREQTAYQAPDFALSRPSVPTDLGWAMKVRQKLEDDVVSLGETLFEYRETCKMFHDAAKTMADAWKQFRKFKRLKFSKLTPRDVATTEVVSVLGVNPLLGTVYDTAQVLMNRIEEPVYRRITSTVSQEHHGVFTSCGGTCEGAWKTSQTARFYLELDIESRRIEIGSPIEIAWELVPFSFVIDWFIPIGDWLGSLDALKGVKNIWGTVTQKQDYTGWDSRKTDYLGCKDPRQTLVHKGRITANYHRRWVQNTIPIPTPRLWKPSASWRKVMTATSLLYLLRDLP